MGDDKYEGVYRGITSVPANAEAITPSDGTDLPNVTRRIYIGVGGDLKVNLLESGTVIYKNLIGGTEKTGSFTRVYADGTTATELIAEW